MADEKPLLSSATPMVPPGESGAAPPPVPAGAISKEPMNLPPIPLAGPKAALALAPAAQKRDAEIVKDAFRELLETVVFVVVLVLMLKTFLAEAFVIPTGSMATTLLGYHYKETCEQCGYTNLINATREAEPNIPGQPQVLTQYQCINCRYKNKRR